MKTRKQSNEAFPTRSSVLLCLVNGSKRFFIASILFAWCTSLLDLVNPKIISFAVDSVIGSAETELPAWLQPLVNSLGGSAHLRGHLGYIALLVVLIALTAGLCRYAFRVMNFKGQESMLTEFDSHLWGCLVDYVTVGKDKGMTVTFRDGTQIKA